MDFKNFCDEKVEAKEKNHKVHINKNNEEEIKKQTNQAFQKYSNYSKQQLMDELIKMTDEKRKDGSLNNEKLMQMYNAISGVIPNESKKNLDDIFNRLK